MRSNQAEHRVLDVPAHDLEELRARRAVDDPVIARERHAHPVLHPGLR
jgi:hypothetical protein